MASKWVPKWLHFYLLFALVFDPFFKPPPNLLFAQTDPPRGAQGTEKAKKGPQNGAKMGPKNSDVAPFLHSEIDTFDSLAARFSLKFESYFFHLLCVILLLIVLLHYSH